MNSISINQLKKVLIIGSAICATFIAAQEIGPLSSIRLAEPVQAASSLWDMQGDFKNEIGQNVYGQPQPKDVREVAVNIIKIFLGLLATILVILILLAGFKWMTAGGNEQKVTEAKDSIRNAVIGLIIILLSYSITLFVAKTLLEINGGII
jgi:hypothetical protein